MDIESDIAYPYTSRFEKRKRENRLNRFAIIALFPMTNPLYALILAGGSGERFWPLSRRARPKQLLQLVSDKTLLEETVARLAGSGAARTNPGPDQRRPGSRRARIAARLAAGKHSSPNRRNATRLRPWPSRAAWVAARDHRATMIVLPADHVIKDRAAFQKTMQTAAARRGRDRRAGHDWHQADLGLPRIWLHRARGARALERRLHAQRRFSGRSLSRKAERRTGRQLSSGKEISAGTPGCLSGRCRRC